MSRILERRFLDPILSIDIDGGHQGNAAIDRPWGACQIARHPDWADAGEAHRFAGNQASSPAAP